MRNSSWRMSMVSVLATAPCQSRAVGKRFISSWTFEMTFLSEVRRLFIHSTRESNFSLVGTWSASRMVLHLRMTSDEQWAMI